MVGCHGCASAESLGKLRMSLTPTSRQSWFFSLFRAVVIVFIVVLVAAWICTFAFYVRPAWLRGIASYGIYWRYSVDVTVHYVILGLSIATGVLAVIGERLEKQSHARFRIVALVCAIVGLITAMVIPMLEPMW